jgi:hypothetical protein
MVVSSLHFCLRCPVWLSALRRTLTHFERRSCEVVALFRRRQASAELAKSTIGDAALGIEPGKLAGGFGGGDSASGNSMFD